MLTVLKALTVIEFINELPLLVIKVINETATFTINLTYKIYNLLVIKFRISNLLHFWLTQS